MRNNQQTEQNVLDLFSASSTFTFNNEVFNIIKVGKPVSQVGDPKTDVYVLGENENNSKELKISIKQLNADFLENKVRDVRAPIIFGDNWREILIDLTTEISDRFNGIPLIYKRASGREEKGAYKLGWRLDIVNTGSANLSVQLSEDILREVLLGEGLTDSKKDAEVNGEVIVNSGIAEYLITIDYENPFSSVEEIMNNLKEVDNYISENGDIYLSCRAIHLRTEPIDKDTGLIIPDKMKMESRHFIVNINWSVLDGKLNYELCFEEPLNKKSSDIKRNLLSCLSELGVTNVSQLNENNVLDYNNIVVD